MKELTGQEHPASSVFSLVLFGIYVLFILMMLLFSAKAYRTSVESKDKNSNLYTAGAYVSSKFHQYDETETVSAEKFGDGDALCFRDEIDGKTYLTRIYLFDKELKELFSAEDSGADAGMGMTIAELDKFAVTDVGDGFLRISMEDGSGDKSSFLLHTGPAGDTQEEDL